MTNPCITLDPSQVVVPAQRTPAANKYDGDLSIVLTEFEVTPNFCAVNYECVIVTGDNTDVDCTTFTYDSSA